MNIERRKKSELILRDFVKNQDFSCFLNIVNSIIFSNNDFLEKPINKDYVEMLKATKAFYRDNRRSDLMIMFNYNILVSKIISILNKITPSDDIISKYAFLIKLLNMNNSEHKSEEYLDYYDQYGLDAIIGNSCCRHRASLIYDVLKEFTDTKRITIGENENGIGNHSIIAVYDENYGKYLFLDSISANLYNPVGNDMIKDCAGNIKYIKANYGITYFDDFYDFDCMDEFFDFYKSINSSHLTNEEYLDVLDEIKVAYELLPLYHSSEITGLKKEFKLCKEKILKQ